MKENDITTILNRRKKEEALFTQINLNPPLTKEEINQLPEKFYSNNEFPQILIVEGIFSKEEISNQLNLSENDFTIEKISGCYDLPFSIPGYPNVQSKTA